MNNAHGDNAHGDQEHLNQRYLHTSYEHDLGVVYRYVFAHVGNRDETERLTAQVFLTAAREQAQHPGRPAKLLTWLLQLALAILVNHGFAQPNTAKTGADGSAAPYPK